MIVKDSILDYILANYSQVELFAKYFKTTGASIEYCLLNTSNKINNPLRNDHNPSLGFMYRDDGRLICKDWAHNIYTGDIFDIVGLLHKLNSNRHLVNIAKVIIDDGNNRIVPNRTIATSDELNARGFVNIKFTARKLNESDIKYLTDGGINIPHFNNRHCYGVDKAWIGNRRNSTYSYSRLDPMYAYLLDKSSGGDEIKLYRPKADNKRDKFRSNSSKIFEGVNELYDAETLVITKSRKDKLVIESNLIIDDEYLCDKEYPHPLSIGTNADSCITSFNSETNRIKSNLASYLKTKYDRVIINVDYDKAGVMNAFYHNILYGFIPVFIGNNNDIYSQFDSKEIERFFSTILNINSHVTLFAGLFKNFIESHRGGYKDKDFFEYFTTNGQSKGEVLVNKLFKI